MRILRSLAPLYVFALLVVVLGESSAVAQQPNPVPTLMPAPNATLNPVPPTASPAPTPSPPQRGRARPLPTATAQRTPEPTPTPTSPAFASLDGTWEVQVQYGDHTTYSYFDLTQSAATLAGDWRYEGKKYVLDGTYDGRLIKMTVKFPQKTVTLSGYVENATDMVGLVDFADGKQTIAFTAEHRAPPSHNLLNRGEPEAGGGRRRGGGNPAPSPKPT